jgi:hypothetical protein
LEHAKEIIHEIEKRWNQGLISEWAEAWKTELEYDGELYIEV